MHCFISDKQATRNFPLVNTLPFIVPIPGINGVTLGWALPAETANLKLHKICLCKRDNKTKCPFCTKANFTTRAVQAECKGKILRRGGLKSLSDFPVDCYIIHCHIHLIFHKCLRLVTFFLTAVNIKYPSVRQSPD